MQNLHVMAFFHSQLKAYWLPERFERNSWVNLSYFPFHFGKSSWKSDKLIPQEPDFGPQLLWQEGHFLSPPWNVHMAGTVLEFCCSICKLICHILKGLEHALCYGKVEGGQMAWTGWCWRHLPPPPVLSCWGHLSWLHIVQASFSKAPGDKNSGVGQGGRATH